MSDTALGQGGHGPAGLGRGTVEGMDLESKDPCSNSRGRFSSYSRCDLGPQRFFRESNPALCNTVFKVCSSLRGSWMTAASWQISVSAMLPPPIPLGAPPRTHSQGSDKSCSVDSCLTLPNAMFNSQPEASLCWPEAPEGP